MDAAMIIAMALVLALVLYVLLGPASFAGPPSDELAYETRERDRMPAEIAQGRLVLSETTLHTNRPFPLVARTDQVYLTPDGRLVPVETKSRFKAAVFSYDTYELSVQAVVIAHAKHPAIPRAPMADYGYVRVSHPDGRSTYLRTALLPADEVVALARRRLALESGRVEPTACQVPNVCRTCAQRPHCPQPAYPR